jgi:RNA recognition motif-containing protein
MARLFLTNIPYDCHETDLQDWIEAHGFDVASVQLIRDQVSGASPAFGYVSLRGELHATDVITSLDGQNMNGRKLQVRWDWRDERYSR